MSAKARLLARLSGRAAVDGAIDARWSELAAYAWQRGGPSRLRGLLLSARLGASGGRLFVGRHARVMFPRRMRVGRNVLIGDHAFISAFGRDGIDIGNDVSLREHAWIQVTSRLDQPGAGLRIGDGTYIGPRCVLGAGGGIRIGSQTAGREASAWAREACDRGAGEILLTSIDRDGTRTGFDAVLTSQISRAVPIPVIASGGAGVPRHFLDVFTNGEADAALAASMFHFSEHAIGDLKRFLADAGVPMRLAAC